MTQRNHPKLNLDMFANLPSEIVIDILSRLPVRTIMRCKCVCKSWLQLGDAHLSKGVPGLGVYRYNSNSNLYEVFDLGDGLDIEHHDLLNDPVIMFNLPFPAWIKGSASGLLFLNNPITNPHSLYICNPIAREYIELPSPQDFVKDSWDKVTYGFGASKITNQHKVVRIFQNEVRDPECPLTVVPNPEWVCHVYTIGTGLWRRIAPVAPLLCEWRTIVQGAFLNGNLHWLVSSLNAPSVLKGSILYKTYQLLIAYFDLETEHFNTFSPPPSVVRHSNTFENALFVLSDCLCLSDNSSDDEIVIWLMKKYGVENSWTKEFVINKNPVVFYSFAHDYDNGVVYPIKLFKNGDILMALEDRVLFYYSKKNRTTQKLAMFAPDIDISRDISIPSGFSLQCYGYILTPSHLSRSHLSLQSFEMENVRSF